VGGGQSGQGATGESRRQQDGDEEGDSEEKTVARGKSKAGDYVRQFNLLFEENCNYGFRRNLWGMKPMGIVLCILGFILGSSAVAIHVQTHAVVSPISYAGLACTLALLIFWIVWCKPNWLRLSADAYAQRLLAAPDTFASAAAGPKKTTRRAKEPKGTMQDH